jgi:hypothetical protein
VQRGGGGGGGLCGSCRSGRVEVSLDLT